jgi:hypothetical protein
MGSGTTHFSAVIKATSMDRSWKNMFVKLRYIQTGFCCVISQFPGNDFNIEICEKFLAFPPKHNANGEYLNHIYVNVFEQLLEDKTTEEIENTTKEILSMLHS